MVALATAEPVRMGQINEKLTQLEHMIGELSNAALNLNNQLSNVVRDPGPPVPSNKADLSPVEHLCPMASRVECIRESARGILAMLADVSARIEL